MLNNLFKGTETTPSVLIQDSITVNGNDLLRGFIINSTRVHHYAVHVACFESPPTRFQNRLNLDVNLDSIQYHDYCTDHRGWFKDDSAEQVVDLLNVGFEKDVKNILVVDSLSTVICQVGFHKTYRQLHGLIQADVKLICLVHDDVLPDFSSSTTKLRHLFATCLRLSPAVDSSGKCGVQTRHIKKGGKVVRKSELFSVDSDNNISFHEMTQTRVLKDAKLIAEEVFPKELTTFKLDLEQNEKAARDKLVLPYLRPEGGGGKVFYEPDDADDWDDEDPDEDLDV